LSVREKCAKNSAFPTHTACLCMSLVHTKKRLLGSTLTGWHFQVDGLCSLCGTNWIWKFR
jgi:hypothetical protein